MWFNSAGDFDQVNKTVTIYHKEGGKDHEVNKAVKQHNAKIVQVKSSKDNQPGVLNVPDTKA